MKQRLTGLHQMRVGLVMALVAAWSGLVLGGIFGGLEPQAHELLADRARDVTQTVYAGNAEAAAAGEKIGWTFWRRAHVHASAMGTTALAFMVVISLLPAGAMMRRAAAYALGVGAIGYPCFLVLAGWLAPVIGTSMATKERCAWLAIPSAGAYLIGSGIVAVIVIRALFADGRASATTNRARAAADHAMAGASAIRPIVQVVRTDRRTATVR